MAKLQQHPPFVHLVGSVPLPTVEDVLYQVSRALPGRLPRIPDGEPGERNHFVRFQRDVFAHTPGILRRASAPHPQMDPYTAIEDNQADMVTTAEVEDITHNMPRLYTGYSDFALSSYSTFCTLRANGIISDSVRFQVSLPTPVNTIASHIRPSMRSAIEPIYEEALSFDIQRLQTEMPKQDLAIQWDIALEFALLEGILIKPWFEPVKDNIIERIVRLANMVDEAVEMGFHLCYGDRGHRHFKEPADASLLVEIATAILTRVKRSVTWIHIPVPKDRDDEAYFAPLSALKDALGYTELYLGLVHAGDGEGTEHRMQTASKFIGNFGIATECGMGRTSLEDMTSILQISAAVS